MSRIRTDIAACLMLAALVAAQADAPGPPTPTRALTNEDIVDLSVVKLVGIVQGPDPFCIVEDAEGIAYVLRKGDRVRNGRVVSISATSLVASQTLLGFTTTVQLSLEEGRESHG